MREFLLYIIGHIELVSSLTCHSECQFHVLLLLRGVNILKVCEHFFEVLSHTSYVRLRANDLVTRCNDGLNFNCTKKLGAMHAINFCRCLRIEFIRDSYKF